MWPVIIKCACACACACACVHACVHARARARARACACACARALHKDGRIWNLKKTHGHTFITMKWR